MRDNFYVLKSLINIRPTSSIMKKYIYTFDRCIICYKTMKVCFKHFVISDYYSTQATENVFFWFIHGLKVIIKKNQFKTVHGYTDNCLSRTLIGQNDFFTVLALSLV